MKYIYITLLGSLLLGFSSASTTGAKADAIFENGTAPWASRAAEAHGNNMESGNEGGNGGDTLNGVTDSAWFLSQDPHAKIRICIEQAADFGMKSDKAKEAIELAFKKWRWYMEEHDVHLVSAGHKFILPTLPEFVGCEQGYDLKIYLGASSAEVEQERKHYNFPAGFASRTSYDTAKGWGHGFIWIASISALRGHHGSGNDYYLLDAIFSHELGHVFGCGHIAGTIMRRDIFTFLQDYLNFQYSDSAENKWEKTLELGSIDQERTLFSTDYVPQYGRTSQFLSNSKAVDELSKLAGRPLLIDPFARLTAFIVRRPTMSTNNVWNYIISFQSTKSYPQPEAFTFEINVDRQSVESVYDTEAFKMTIGSDSHSFPGGVSRVYLGTAIIYGKLYQVLIALNSANPAQQVAVRIFIDGKNILIN